MVLIISDGCSLIVAHMWRETGLCWKKIRLIYCCDINKLNEGFKIYHFYFTLAHCDLGNHLIEVPCSSLLIHSNLCHFHQDDNELICLAVTYVANVSQSPIKTCVIETRKKTFYYFLNPDPDLQPLCHSLINDFLDFLQCLFWSYIILRTFYPCNYPCHPTLTDEGIGVIQYLLIISKMQISSQ